MATWREIGVPAELLRRAGIGRAAQYDGHSSDAGIVVDAPVGPFNLIGPARALGKALMDCLATHHQRHADSTTYDRSCDKLFT